MQKRGGKKKNSNDSDDWHKLHPTPPPPPKNTNQSKNQKNKNRDAKEMKINLKLPSGEKNKCKQNVEPADTQSTNLHAARRCQKL